MRETKTHGLTGRDQLAWFASAVVLLLAVFPAALGSGHYSSAVAMDLVSALSVIWATKYAAENIAEMRAIREAELLPLLQVALRATQVNGDTVVMAELHNLGKGGAIALRAELWKPDADGLLFPAATLPFPSFIPAGSHVEASLELPVVTYWSAAQQFVAIEVHVDTARARNQSSCWYFQLIEHEMRLLPYVGDDAPRLEHKRATIQERANALARCYAGTLARPRFTVDSRLRRLVLEVDGVEVDERKPGPIVEVDYWIERAESALQLATKRRQAENGSA